MKPPAESQDAKQPPTKDSTLPVAGSVISTGTVFSVLLETLNRGAFSAEHEREVALLQACIDERITVLLKQERRKQRRRQLRIALLALLILLCLLGAFVAGLLVGANRAG